jgi:DNA repair ATPase RecN
MEANRVVERIRLLLARFSEDEETVRRLVATDPSFDALCHKYGKVIELLDRFEAEVKRLRKAIESLDRFEAEVKRLTQLRASLEEQLLTRIEGHQPQ